ncbi:hypothetical protein M422DRAFT_25255 [Sphaerobolus stellatus SS14]|nr:hypothetical protein M422DRAFT_25255 [Sphaerobolus stellatus SS14]
MILLRAFTPVYLHANITLNPRSEVTLPEDSPEARSYNLRHIMVKFPDTPRRYHSVITSPTIRRFQSYT